MNQQSTVAVVGAGERGKEIIAALSLLSDTSVKYICDTYTSPLFQKKALENAPKATFVTDYKQVLGDATVKGVFVATPTHLHKQIVLDALQAGKHVFCEAPLAHTIEDAKAIADAAAAHPNQLFQVGLQNRSNPQHHHVKHFMDTGALGTLSGAEANWNKKASWRRSAPTPEREAALNWRLNSAQSHGLIGEIGIHAIDSATWYLKAQPLSVTGFGNERTATAVVEYPGGVRLTYSATLGSSFGGGYQLFRGDNACVLIRETRGWLFFNEGSYRLGWEVYARTETIGDDRGSVLVANASKLLSQGLEPSKNIDTNPRHTPLFFACEGFINSLKIGKPTGMTSASASGENYPLETYPLYATAKAGFDATRVAILANEAVRTGTKINL